VVEVFARLFPPRSSLPLEATSEKSKTFSFMKSTIPFFSLLDGLGWRPSGPQEGGRPLDSRLGCSIEASLSSSPRTPSFLFIKQANLHQTVPFSFLAHLG